MCSHGRTCLSPNPKAQMKGLVLLESQEDELQEYDGHFPNFQPQERNLLDEVTAHAHNFYPDSS